MHNSNYATALGCVPRSDDFNVVNRADGPPTFQSSTVELEPGVYQTDKGKLS